MLPRTLALSLLILGGCGNSRIQITPLDSAPEDAPFEHDGILTTTGDVDAAYEEIAILTVGPQTGKWATKKLLANFREAAARVGADAVVRVDFDVYGSGESGSQTHMATGTAVRYK